MEEKNSVTLADVKAAAERIAPYIRAPSCCASRCWTRTWDAKCT